MAEGPGAIVSMQLIFQDVSSNGTDVDCLYRLEPFGWGLQLHKGIIQEDNRVQQANNYYRLLMPHELTQTLAALRAALEEK